MNRNRKAAIAAGLAVTLGLGLSACGSGGSDETVVLKLMFWGDQDAPDAWNGITEAFIADGHENVEFEFIHQPAEYETKIQTLIAANKAPDAFILNNANIGRFAEDGALLDLAPEFEKAGHDVDAEFAPQAVVRWDGALVALAPSLHVNVLWYDKAAFDEAGVAYPASDIADAWSWDEFEDAARDLTRGEGNDKRWGTVVWPYMTIWTPLVQSNGGDWWNDDATEFTLNSPEAVEVFEDIHAMETDGISVPAADLSTVGEVLVQSRKVGMFIGATWDLVGNQEAWGDDLGVAVIPEYDEPVATTFVDPLVGYAGTEHPELVAEFIHFAAANPLTNPLFAGAPTSLEYLEGDKRAEWLENSELPDGYVESVTAAISVGRAHPAAQVATMVEIEWPLVMTEAYLKYWQNEIDDIGAALDGVKPAVDAILTR